MRIFNSCKDMMNEVARDLVELGVERKTQTMQDKNIYKDPKYFTKELFNYSFCLTDIKTQDLMHLFNIPGSGDVCFNWCNAEFIERVSVGLINPGEAYKLRKSIWNEFLRKNNGKFSYTYNERIRVQLGYIVNILKEDIFTRQAVMSIWNPILDAPKMGRDRVPCSIFYHFLATEVDDIVKLNLIYNMRSSDFITHFANDVYLAIKMLIHVSKIICVPFDKFYMNVSSLHYYAKDDDVMDKFMKGEQ